MQKHQAGKKGAATKCQGGKRCEIKGGGQEMTVIIRSSLAKILITTIQVNLCVLLQVSLGLGTNSCELLLLKFLPLNYYHSHILATTFDFTSFSPWHFGAAPFF